MTGHSVRNMELLASLPPEWVELLPAIREEIGTSRQKIVILDDDPTGTQTARDLPVLTHWTSAPVPCCLVDCWVSLLRP